MPKTSPEENHHKELRRKKKKKREEKERKTEFWSSGSLSLSELVRKFRGGSFRTHTQDTRTGASPLWVVLALTQERLKQPKARISIVSDATLFSLGRGEQNTHSLLHREQRIAAIYTAQPGQWGWSFSLPCSIVP